MKRSEAEAVIEAGPHYIVYSRAWYGPEQIEAERQRRPGFVDDIHFGVTAYGSATLVFERIGTESEPSLRLEVWSDALPLLREPAVARLLDLLIGNRQRAPYAPTLDETIRALEECGFRNATPDEDPFPRR